LILSSLKTSTEKPLEIANAKGSEIPAILFEPSHRENLNRNTTAEGDACNRRQSESASEVRTLLASTLKTLIARTSTTLEPQERAMHTCTASELPSLQY
jgi:hypothetical protein